MSSVHKLLPRIAGGNGAPIITIRWGEGV